MDWASYWTANQHELDKWLEENIERLSDPTPRNLALVIEIALLRGFIKGFDSRSGD